LAGLNVLQGESLFFDPEVSLLPPKAGSVRGKTEGQDEPCPLVDKSLLYIGAGVHPAPK